MVSHEAEALANRYLDAQGRVEGERYQLTIEELAWLVEHSVHLSELRLGLLRALQAALPLSEERGGITELKELLTNLIIMQTRLTDREEKLHDLLHQLIEARMLDHVLVDGASLKRGIQHIGEAAGHVRSVAGD